MAGTVTINLAKAITSAKMLDDYSSSAGHSGVNTQKNGDQIKPSGDLESQKAALSQVCRTLQELVEKLNQFSEKIFTEHREEIAKLSVEIARKILVQKVQEDDYQIESIIKEALKNAPAHQDMVVHLNSEDLVQYQKLQQDEKTGTLAGIKFVADSNIGRAECLIESPKGIIESLINEHLEQIGKALEKAE